MELSKFLGREKSIDLFIPTLLKIEDICNIQNWGLSKKHVKKAFNERYILGVY